MSRETNIEVVQRWYDTLAGGDVEGFVAVHHPECIYNISGHTPISGQVRGMQNLTTHVTPLVFGSLDMDNFTFATRRQIMCADDQRVVGIMEADGPSNNGLRYDQRYLHVFQCEGDQITQVWEFFDTALANAVMFTDPDQVVPGVERGAFALE